MSFELLLYWFARRSTAFSSTLTPGRVWSSSICSAFPEGVIGSMSRSVSKGIIFIDDGVLVAVILGGRHDAEACRQHKELMFRSPDHRYDRAVPGTYRLVPTPAMRKKLAVDCERMSAMIFAALPGFEAVRKSIEELQEAANSAK